MFLCRKTRPSSKKITLSNATGSKHQDQSTGSVSHGEAANQASPSLVSLAQAQERSLETASWRDDAATS